MNNKTDLLNSFYDFLEIPKRDFSKIGKCQTDWKYLESLSEQSKEFYKKVFLEMGQNGEHLNNETESEVS